MHPSSPIACTFFYFIIFFCSHSHPVVFCHSKANRDNTEYRSFLRKCAFPCIAHVCFMKSKSAVICLIVAHGVFLQVTKCSGYVHTCKIPGCPAVLFALEELPCSPIAFIGVKSMWQSHKIGSFLCATLDAQLLQLRLCSQRIQWHLKHDMFTLVRSVTVR